MKLPGTDRVWDLTFFRLGVKANRKARTHRGRCLWGQGGDEPLIPRKEALELKQAVLEEQAWSPSLEL